MKKIVLLIMCFMLFLTGCGNAGKNAGNGSSEAGGDNSSQAEENNADEEEDTAAVLKGIMDKMMAAGKNLPSMLHVDPSTENAEVYFASLSTVDFNRVRDFIYESTSDTDNPAPELAVIKVWNMEDVEDVEKSLREHLQSRRITFENYSGQIDERQMPMIDSAEVFSENDYVVLIVAENAKDIKQAFYDEVRQ